MIATDSESLMELRELYRRSRSAAAVVRAIASRGSESRLEWAKQLRAAFGLSLSQVSPIGGWELDGTGELKDEQLDGFLVPAIESTRSVWDRP
jgi:hypothetical protein